MQMKCRRTTINDSRNPSTPTLTLALAKTGCATVPPPLTNQVSTACSHSADPVTATV